MTATALLETLRVRGVTLEAVGDRLRFRPREAVTPELREALARHKADLLALLNRSNRPAPLRPVQIPAGAPAFTETITALLRLPLDRFAEEGQCLEVRVPWHSQPLWFVPTPTDAAVLEAEGITRGRVWTARELADLLAIPGLTKAGARTAALAKLMSEGEVVAVRPRLAEPCPACHRGRWWRSIHGPEQCATCHPPAASVLAAEWVNERPLSGEPLPSWQMGEDVT